MSDVTILIPAAGASSRMRGGDKLLELVDGEAQLTRIAKAALASSAQVIVTLGPDHIARKMVLPVSERLQVLNVPEADEGMAASLRAAVKEAADAAGLMIVPGDMPEISNIEIQEITARFSCDPNGVFRGASEDGTPGHPVIIPRRLFPRLQALKGDEGARSVLAGEQVTLVPLPGQCAVTDLDTPEDWARWRAARGK